MSTCTLREEGLQPLTAETVALRSQLVAEEAWDHPLFTYAKAFAAADHIVIAAPYWDLSFPTLLKNYLELVCVHNLTFSYNPQRMGKCCQAKKLTYITTSGGPIGDYNLGFQYIEGLCKTLFGIPETKCISVQGLDVEGADVEALMAKGMKRV